MGLHSDRLIDAFLKTGDLRIEFQHIGGGGMSARQLLRPRDTAVPRGRAHSLVVMRLNQSRWCVLANRGETCPSTIALNPPGTMNSPMYTWMMKAPMVTSAATSWMTTAAGLRARGAYSGNHITIPESSSRIVPPAITQ